MFCPLSVKIWLENYKSIRRFIKLFWSVSWAMFLLRLEEKCINLCPLLNCSIYLDRNLFEIDWYVIRAMELYRINARAIVFQNIAPPSNWASRALVAEETLSVRRYVWVVYILPLRWCSAVFMWKVLSFLCSLLHKRNTFGDMNKAICLIRILSIGLSMIARYFSMDGSYDETDWRARSYDLSLV